MDPNRQKLLYQILESPKNLPLIESQLHQFPWHCDEGEDVVIEIHHLVNAFTKPYDGKITTKEFVDWADCIIMREDIEVEDVQISEILTEIACYYGEVLPKDEIQKYLTSLNTSD